MSFSFNLEQQKKRKFSINTYRESGYTNINAILDVKGRVGDLVPLTIFRGRRRRRVGGRAIFVMTLRMTRIAQHHAHFVSDILRGDFLENHLWRRKILDVGELEDR